MNNSVDFSSPATLILIANILASLYGFGNNGKRALELSLQPYHLARGKQVHTLVTHGFVHADIGHLMFNMFSFYFFAFTLEEVLGPVLFTVIYFLSLFGSSLPTLITHRNNPMYASLGASGAVTGVIFSFILFFPSSTLMIMPIPVPIPAAIFGVIYLFVCQWLNRGQRGDNINHSAHFWGGICGVVSTLILVPESIFIFLDNLPFVR